MEALTELTINFTLSAVFITYNEEKNIERAILSIKDMADEIIVLDSGSGDKTLEIAKKHNALIFSKKFESFASQKNAAISHAAKEYVLVLDADEELSEPLKKWISRLKSDADFYGKFKTYDGFYLPRKSSFIGKWINHSGWFPDYTLRLVKNGAAQFKETRVHESFKLNGSSYKLPADCFLWHYTYESLEQYFNKFNSYTTLAAEDLYERNKSGSKVKILFNPVFGFIKQYFIKLGFLDGFHGFVLAVLSALYVFVKYCKHYFLCVRKNNGK